MASRSLLEVNLSLQEGVGASVFAIRSSEVFALGGDLQYIFYGSCSGVLVTKQVVDAMIPDPFLRKVF